jgi:hypothetical protein
MITQVQFRKYKGEILAVFPYEISSNYSVTCYAHVGQHCSCIWNINQFSKSAKPEEYKYLLNELKSLGYELAIIKKRNHRRFLIANDEYLKQRDL